MSDTCTEAIHALNQNISDSKLILPCELSAIWLCVPASPPQPRGARSGMGLSRRKGKRHARKETSVEDKSQRPEARPVSLIVEPFKTKAGASVQAFSALSDAMSAALYK